MTAIWSAVRKCFTFTPPRFVAPSIALLFSTRLAFLICARVSHLGEPVEDCPLHQQPRIPKRRAWIIAPGELHDLVVSLPAALLKKPVGLCHPAETLGSCRDSEVDRVASSADDRPGGHLLRPLPVGRDIAGG